MITMTGFKSEFIKQSEISNPPDVDAWLMSYLLPMMVETADEHTSSVRIAVEDLPFDSTTMKEVRWFRSQLNQRGFSCEISSSDKGIIRLYGLNLT